MKVVPGAFSVPYSLLAHLVYIFNREDVTRFATPPQTATPTP
jgi:hypothetical protein